jgi:hypothetical protein
MALAALMLLAGGCERRGADRPTQALPAVAAAGRLQEVSPPGAVQQLEAALASHRPRLRITSPAEGALLPAGPWQLGLVLEDWPLVQDPDLGLGPHLVVQVDEGPGERIGDWRQGEAGSGRLNLAMAALAPGSHRISVYAALPWGEAVKLPGATAQLRVDRVAANPVSQPAPGSAQLLVVSPDSLSQSEPVLIDWLLRDAPLQGLRDGDARWRLRITVNGDSFLVDQNTPLWLRGMKPGSNALLLELLDGLGEPLNPPFNSLVREVVIQAGGARPVWLNERLSASDLARLLGEAPPQNMPSPERAVGAEPEPEGEESASARTNAADQGNAQEDTPAENDPAAGRAQTRAEPSLEEQAPEPAPEQLPEPVPAPELDRSPDSAELPDQPPTPGEPVTPPPSDATPTDAVPADAVPADAAPADAVPADAVPADRIQLGTSLSGLATRVRP